MKVLIVGSGAREHALAWRFEVEGAEVVVAPGNAGTPHTVAVQPSDIDALANLAVEEGVDLTVVGPELPLALGLVDRFSERGLPIVGPTRSAAQLEWSKAWTKSFLRRHAIPTGRAEVVESEAAARRVIAARGLPTVLKADGLSAGKGVFVVHTTQELEAAVDHLFYRRTFGSAADQVVIEEYLEGPELSVLAFTDGEHLAVMPPARDYKRLLDGDRGPNTGGMGGYTWPSYATPSLLEDIEQRILKPTLAGMSSAGHPYRGILFAGLIITNNGPKVLEFNCRFGDPECQLILPLLDSSLMEVCASVAFGELRPADVRWSRCQTFGVVLAASGYPDAPTSGDAIHGLDEVPEDVLAFHAGTRLTPDGSVVTAGGRVLTVVGFERERVYRAAEVIRFAGKQYRPDIGVEVSGMVGARV